MTFRDFIKYVSSRLLVLFVLLVVIPFLLTIAGCATVSAQTIEVEQSQAEASEGEGAAQEQPLPVVQEESEGAGVAQVAPPPKVEEPEIIEAEESDPEPTPTVTIEVNREEWEAFVASYVEMAARINELENQQGSDTTEDQIRQIAEEIILSHQGGVSTEVQELVDLMNQENERLRDLIDSADRETALEAVIVECSQLSGDEPEVYYEYRLGGQSRCFLGFRYPSDASYLSKRGNYFYLVLLQRGGNTSLVRYTRPADRALGDNALSPTDGSFDSTNTIELNCRLIKTTSANSLLTNSCDTEQMYNLDFNMLKDTANMLVLGAWWLTPDDNETLRLLGFDEVVYFIDEY